MRWRRAKVRGGPSAGWSKRLTGHVRLQTTTGVKNSSQRRSLSLSTFRSPCIPTIAPSNTTMRIRARGRFRPWIRSTFADSSDLHLATYKHESCASQVRAQGFAIIGKSGSSTNGVKGRKKTSSFLELETLIEFESTTESIIEVHRSQPPTVRPRASASDGAMLTLRPTFNRLEVQ